jgi:hypothetical protein
MGVSQAYHHMLLEGCPIADVVKPTMLPFLHLVPSRSIWSELRSGWFANARAPQRPWLQSTG